jgi:hypothetical protein
MASFSVSPATLRIAPQSATFIPARFSVSPATVAITGQTATFSIIQAVEIPRVERLQRYEQRFGEKSQLTLREQLVQQRNAEEIESAFRQVNNNIAAVEATLNLALAGLAKATAIDDKLEVEGSYTNPVNIGSADSGGTVTIAAHNRIYSGTSSKTVAVDAGAVTGLSSGDYVTVFYRDAARVGGAVTYETTTNAIAQTGNVHIVWQGVIPAPGEPSNSGSSPSGPGYIPPEDPTDGGVYQ